MRKIILLIVILFSSCCWLRAADNSQVTAIRAGKIWTATGSVIINGVIIIKNGKIDAFGANLSIPKNARILDMPDKSVMPGVIDMHSHLGLALDIFGEIEEDTFAITPDMQILDAFEPENVKKSLRSGVTTVLLAPGYRNPIAGQTAVVKLKQDDWILKRSAGIKFSLGDQALTYNRQPTSRPGLIALVKNELNKAKGYKETEILKRVIDGKLPVYIYCDTVDEITAAIEIIDEYKLNAILVGAREGDELASMIAERKIPVIYTPMLLLSKDKDLRRIVKLAEAGVKIAFASVAPGTDPGDLRTSAIIAVKYGLNPETALKSLTINAADILGLCQRIGSIEKGKDADLVILNGDPLELTSGVEVVIINGEIVYQKKNEK